MVTSEPYATILAVIFSRREIVSQLKSGSSLCLRYQTVVRVRAVPEKISTATEKSNKDSDIFPEKTENLRLFADFALYFSIPGLYYVSTALSGEMVEWSKAPHWKCGVLQGTEGSNPSLSAIFILNS